MHFFSETRPLLGHFLKKSVFCPLEMSNTCKNFQNPKIDQKMAKYETPPPFFSPEIFFTKMTQNGLKWILNTTLKNVTFCRREINISGQQLINLLNHNCCCAGACGRGLHFLNSLNFRPSSRKHLHQPAPGIHSVLRIVRAVLFKGSFRSSDDQLRGEGS